MRVNPVCVLSAVTFAFGTTAPVLSTTAGNDVEAAAEARENVQYSEIGVRLDGVADKMRRSRERAVERGAVRRTALGRRREHRGGGDVV